MKALAISILLFAAAASAQLVPASHIDSLEGQWQGFDGEWGHVSRQLIALAETIPSDKYAWRPGPGVRSTSEVFMHIAISNFWLLGVTGPPMPNDLTSNELEKSVTAKSDVVNWLFIGVDDDAEVDAVDGGVVAFDLDLAHQITGFQTGPARLDSLE